MTYLSRPHAMRLLLPLAVVMGSCNGKESDKPDVAVAADSMSAMPGMTPSPSVTLSAAQIREGHVRWSPAETASVAATVEVPAQIVANDDATARIGSPAQAQVLAVHVQPGQRVARGTALMTLRSQEAGIAQADLANAEASVSSKRAAATYARSTRERAERLLALKAIPQQDVERAIADDELARSELRQAQAELARARSAAAQLGVGDASGTMVLRSPIRGVVVAREAVPGTVVTPGTPLITITDPSSLWLTLGLTELLAPFVRTGDRIRFRVAAFPNELFSARIQSVGGGLDAATRTLPVRAVVNNAGDKLRPEMFATAWISGGPSRPAVLVPDSAVQRLENRDVVFVARPDGKGGARFEPREVVIGAAPGGRTTILNGLRAGDLVVTDGAFAVKSEFAKASMSPMEM